MLTTTSTFRGTRRRKNTVNLTHFIDNVCAEKLREARTLEKEYLPKRKISFERKNIYQEMPF